MHRSIYYEPRDRGAPLSTATALCAEFIAEYLSAPSA